MAGKTAIGLDIGSSGVRAAEVSFGKNGITLEKFGQVELPEGSVRDGEVIDTDAVATAIKHLWAHSKFSSKSVVLGVANGKVIVRQVELPWMPAADLKQFPTIQGPTPPASLHPGVAWKDPSLQAAARLAQILAPTWSKLRLESIIAPSRLDSKSDASKITLKLQTGGGSQIIWGRAPGTEHPGELTTTQKIGRLEKYLTEFGGFDRPNGPYEIDIRHWQEISRRPLASEQANSPKGSRTRH